MSKGIKTVPPLGAKGALRVTEIFYSLQGEGTNTGVPAVFVRLAGCNLKCWFCDTDFSRYTEMTEEDILNKVCDFPSEAVIITGGEPTLQLNARLIQLLHEAGKTVLLETNGTLPLPDDYPVDWIVCSPKAIQHADREWELHPLRIQHIDELKVVYEDNPLQPMHLYEQIPAEEYCLQPCDTGDAVRNSEVLQAAIRYVKDHPRWRLSLQTHKLLNIP